MTKRKNSDQPAPKRKNPLRTFVVVLLWTVFGCLVLLMAPAIYKGAILTPTYTPSITLTPSLTFTPSDTPTSTLTPTPSDTPTATNTFTSDEARTATQAAVFMTQTQRPLDMTATREQRNANATATQENLELSAGQTATTIALTPRIVITWTPAPAVNTAPPANDSSNGSSSSGSSGSAGGFDPTKPSAKCKDGTTVYTQHRQGTCSGHKGVAEWLQNVPK